jgi:uracil-DNA glycosylase
MLEGWEKDLPKAWQSATEGVKLNFESHAFDRQLHANELIIPGRQRTVASAPAGAHIFRAFQGTDPNRVRVIILGQEPYPKPSWATGRAFEQGNPSVWPENNKLIATSLRRIVQVLASARDQDASYVAGDRGWKTLARDLRDGKFHLEPPRRLFEHLEDQGVLLLNSSLTVSVERHAGRMKRSGSHFRLWEPLLCRVLCSIAARKSGHVVFLLWGQQAFDIFEHCGTRLEAESAGNWRTRLAVIRHPHPAAITSKGAVFLHHPNPFLETNKALTRMGAEPIAW